MDIQAVCSLPLIGAVRIEFDDGELEVLKLKE